MNIIEDKKSQSFVSEHFIPRSDYVLFVTSVDRPFSESEVCYLKNRSKVFKQN